MPTPTEVAARSIASKGVAAPDLIADVESFLGIAATDSITAAVPAVAEAGAVTVEVAGEATAALGLWPFVLILLITLCTLRVMENAIIYPFGLIPHFGSDVQGAIKSGFRWLDNFENAIINLILNTVGRLITAALTLFTFMLGITLPRVQAPQSTPVPNHTGYASEDEIQRLQAQINTLNKAVGTLEFTLDPVATPFNPPASAPGSTTNTTQVTQVIKVGVPQTVWDQIHHLEGQMTAVHTSIADLYGRTDRLTNTATSLEKQFAQLSSEIHAVRAVSASWQDIEQQLENLGTLTTQLADETAAELGKVTAVQTQMLPLTLLLEPGIKGLRNLRKLEDNICQCPKFANIPNELGTALAVLEFVENG